MKTLNQIVVGLILITTGITQAQPVINVNLSNNSDRWQPSSYDDTDYYYLPEIACYYNVRTANYFYLENGNWTCSINLPRAYYNFNLNRCNKIALSHYRGNRPYEYFNNHVRVECKNERRYEEPNFPRRNYPRYSYNQGYLQYRNYTYNAPRGYERESDNYSHRNNCERENRREYDRRR